MKLNVGNGVGLNDMHSYSFANRTWSRIFNLPLFKNGAALARSRSGAAVDLSTGNFYLLGGELNSTPTQYFTVSSYVECLFNEFRCHL